MPKIAMGCEDIRKRLPLFLEDLLSEEEYRSFLEHLDVCQRCHGYVRSIGDLSNQLWKLGDLKAPSDFASTVFFKLKSAGPAPAPNVPLRLPKKAVIPMGALALALAAGLFYAANYFQKAETSLAQSRMTDAVAVSVNDTIPASDMRLPHLDSSEYPAPPPAAASESPEQDEEQAASLETPGAALAQPAPKHWHLIYAGAAERQRFDEEKRRRQLRLEELVREIRDMEAELRVLEVRDPDETVEAREQKTRRIQEIAQSARRLQAEATELEDEKKRSEAELRQSLGSRKWAERKSKVSEALAGAAIPFEFATPNLLIFTASAEKIERSLEHVFSVFNEPGALEDFTPGPPEAEREERVSVYFEDMTLADLHWHVGGLGAAQRNRFFEAVRGLGGSIDKDAGETAVFLIPKTELRKLSVRAEAMRLRVSEFGRGASSEGVLSNAPVKISVYFE